MNEPSPVGESGELRAGRMWCLCGKDDWTGEGGKVGMNGNV